MTQQPTRRELIKGLLAGGIAGTSAAPGLATAGAAAAGSPQLKIGGYAYDRVRAIQDGRLTLDGFDTTFQAENIYTLNRLLFGSEQTFEVSETGLIPFITRYANDDFRAYTLIPVFLSRTFRHRNIFVRTDRGISKPEDLRGKRIATTGYGMSACTWIRGFLQDQHGVAPADMQWIETAKSSDGGKLNAKLGRYYLPSDFPLTRGREGVDESEMIAGGEVDAVISATAPQAAAGGDQTVRPLFPDYRAAEQAYYRQTRVFPIMHVLAIRTEVAAANPDLPRALFSLYSRAKQAAYDDLAETGVLHVTLPWAASELDETRALMGNNYWSYGVAANRRELDLVLRYTHEQGLAKRRVAVEEIFHRSTLELAEA